MVLLVHVLKINWINQSFVQFYMLHYQHFSKTEPKIKIEKKRYLVDNLRRALNLIFAT